MGPELPRDVHSLSPLVVKLNLNEGNINVNDGTRNPVLIPEKKKERKTSTEIVGAERGTWKQEITLLKGLNPTDIKEFLPKPPDTCIFEFLPKPSDTCIFEFSPITGHYMISNHHFYI